MFTSVAQANAAVIEQIRRARPHWLDVQPASSLISELNKGKTLLHAGPPMRWQEMTGPMKGACVGLDIRRVVETGITPLINTGIAHKEAGIGQIGAGTVRAPLACFEQALEALAESMGIG